jgi:hypothetical protein
VITSSNCSCFRLSQNTCMHLIQCMLNTVNYRYFMPFKLFPYPYTIHCINCIFDAMYVKYSQVSLFYVMIAEPPTGIKNVPEISCQTILFSDGSRKKTRKKQEKNKVCRGPIRVSEREPLSTCKRKPVASSYSFPHFLSLTSPPSTIDGK